VLRIAERMMAANRQHPDSGIHGVGRHDTEYAPTCPNLAQHIARLPLVGAENPHSAT